MQEKGEFLSDWELDECSRALVEWFKSQSLKPIDAVPVCIKVIARAFSSLEEKNFDEVCSILSTELKRCLEGKQ